MTADAFPGDNLPAVIIRVNCDPESKIPALWSCQRAGSVWSRPLVETFALDRVPWLKKRVEPRFPDQPRRKRDRSLITCSTPRPSSSSFFGRSNGRARDCRRGAWNSFPRYRPRGDAPLARSVSRSIRFLHPSSTSHPVRQRPCGIASHIRRRISTRISSLSA